MSEEGMPFALVPNFPAQNNLGTDIIVPAGGFRVGRIVVPNRYAFAVGFGCMTSARTLHLQVVHALNCTIQFINAVVLVNGNPPPGVYVSLVALSLSLSLVERAMSWWRG